LQSTVLKIEISTHSIDIFAIGYPRCALISDVCDDDDDDDYIDDYMFLVVFGVVNLVKCPESPD